MLAMLVDDGRVGFADIVSISRVHARDRVQYLMDEGGSRGSPSSSSWRGSPRSEAFTS